MHNKSLFSKLKSKQDHACDNALKHVRGNEPIPTKKISSQMPTRQEINIKTNYKNKNKNKKQHLSI